MKKIKIPVEVSARHFHPCQKDLEKLFGKNFQLTKKKDLSQHGQFAAEEEVVAVSDPRYKFRVVGPVRPESQVELALTDTIRLHIEAPIVLSGDLKKLKPQLAIKGPCGKIKVKAIVAKRHLHCLRSEAKELGLKKGQLVKVEIIGPRGLIFDNVVVRPGDKYSLSCHLDTDEANACGLGKVCGYGFLITQNSNVKS